MKHAIWLYTFVWFLSPIALWAQAGQSQQGLEMSVLALRRQKAWGFSDGKPDPATFFKGDKRDQPENEGWIVTNYEGTIEPNGLKLTWSQGRATGTRDFDFVRVEEAAPSQTSNLRFDGLYRCPQKFEDDPLTYYTYLRFFQNGTVGTITTSMDLADSWKSLKNGTKSTYTTEDLKIRFFEAFRSQQAAAQQKPLFRASPGYDMVVLLLKVKTREANATLDFSRLRLEDEQGKPYECPLKQSDICGEGVEGKEETCGVPFLVPEGARLSKLRYGEASFDLQHLESKADAPR